MRTVRSFSMLGFSTIYVIFEEDVEFYWSRTRVLEKLSSLSADTVVPTGDVWLALPEENLCVYADEMLVSRNR